MVLNCAELQEQNAPYMHPDIMLCSMTEPGIFLLPPDDICNIYEVEVLSIKSQADADIGQYQEITLFEQKKSHRKLVNGYGEQLFKSHRRIIRDSNKIVKTEIGIK
jgi:hypothetical protein